MKESQIEMTLPCHCNYFDNNLQSTIAAVKCIAMNACHCRMFKNLEFFSVAVLI